MAVPVLRQSAAQSTVTFGSGNVPSSRKDAQGAMGYMHKSSPTRGVEPGLIVFSWWFPPITSG